MIPIHLEEIERTPSCSFIPLMEMFEINQCEGPRWKTTPLTCWSTGEAGKWHALVGLAAPAARWAGGQLCGPAAQLVPPYSSFVKGLNEGHQSHSDDFLSPDEESQPATTRRGTERSQYVMSFSFLRLSGTSLIIVWGPHRMMTSSITLRSRSWEFNELHYFLTQCRRKR